MPRPFPHRFQPVRIGPKQSRYRIMRLATSTNTGPHAQNDPKVMPLPRYISWIFPIALTVPGVGVVSGQTHSASSGQAASTGSGQAYPYKPIRLLTSEPGGAGDFASRLMAQELRSGLGQPVVIDNRAGAILSGQVTAHASPDGYTVLLAASNLWLQPFLFDTAPFDPIRDFSPITLTTTSPLVVVVHPSVSANSVKELIALAKARPGALNYGSGNTASSSHLGPELFKSMTGVNIVRVPYKGAGPALNALIAGEVQMMIASSGSAMPHVKSGRLKALAVTSPEPSALLPGLPTVAASGLPGYNFAQTLGALAPAKTPAAIIKRLHQELVRALNQPEVKQKLFNGGLETVGNSPQQFGAMIKSDMTTLGKVIRDSGIRE